jgi:hypothetical protein
MIKFKFYKIWFLSMKSTLKTKMNHHLKMLKIFVFKYIINKYLVNGTKKLEKIILG